jgi:hypothetical protein
MTGRHREKKESRRHSGLLKNIYKACLVARCGGAHL